MIPAEAVEAAAKAVYEYTFGTEWEGAESDYQADLCQSVKISLEAAAPHMLAEAWREGHAAGRDYQGDGWNADRHDPECDNPHKVRA